jgi:hypothetical protein
VKPRRRATLATLSAVLALAARSAPAQLAELVVTPDTALSLPGLAAPVLDRDAARGPWAGSGTRWLEDLGALPAGIGLAAFDYAADGARLFVLEGWAELPGIGPVGPADVVARKNGAYQVAFSGAARGIPAGVSIDALAVSSNGDLLLSFDATVALPGGIVADDEDVVDADGGGFVFVYQFTGRVAGGLDLDGLASSPDGDTWYLSFDGSGELAGVGFDDEDILAWNGASATLLFDGSAAAPGWSAADLADFAILPGAIFADGFETGDAARWSAAMP